MIKYYCGGLFPLITFISSGHLKSNDIIYFIRYKKEEWENPNHENEKWLVDLISVIFNITIEYSPIYTDKNKPKFNISEGDFVSENILTFLKKDIKDFKINCVAEGASGLRHLYFDTWWIRGEILNNRNLKYILFDDCENTISKFNKYNVEILNFELIKTGFLKLKNKLSEELNFDFDRFDYIFCPFLLDSLENQFNLLYRFIKKDTKVLIKKHPSDFRSYDEFIKNHNFIFLDEVFNLIPLELFFLNNSSKFIGFYSTTILFVPINRIFILDLNTSRIKTHLKNEGKYLYKIQEKRGKNYENDRRNKN